MDHLPLAIVIPHSGLEIPPELTESVALDERQIFNEADAFADQLYDFRDQVVHWVRFPFARAVIDVNRPQEAALNRPGDGIVKRRTSYGAAVFKEGQEPDLAFERLLVERYWCTWHRQLALIAADKRVKLVIDAHTMASRGPLDYDDPGMLRPRVSVSNLGDHDGRSRLENEHLSAEPKILHALAHELGQRMQELIPLDAVGEPVAINSPYYGGWDIWHHGNRHQPWLMVEVNRAMYLGPQMADTGILSPDTTHLKELRMHLWQAVAKLFADGCL